MAAAAVVIWAVVLSCLALVPACRTCPTLARVATLALALALAANTRMAQHALGSLLYSVLDGRIVNVGFWGGPPTWIAPVTAALAGVTMWAMQATRARLRRG